MKKKTLYITTLMLGTALGALNAYAGGSCGATDADCHWELENGVLTISGSGAIADYNYYDDAPWYSDSASITSVVLEGADETKGTTGITSIGTNAFGYAHSLQSITLPNSLTSIGASAFNMSGLTSITIPDSVTSIGEEAFSGNYSLQSITLPDSLTSIGPSAFAGSGLTSLTIPDSVTSIGNWAFGGISSLEKLYCPSTIDCTGKGYEGDIISYTKEDDLYKIGDDYYASLEDMQKGSEFACTTDCAEKVAAYKNAKAASMAGGSLCATQQECLNLMKMVDDDDYECTSIATCSTYAKDPTNNITLASLYGASSGSGSGSGGGVAPLTPSAQAYTPKRIYTIQEANDRTKELDGDTFTFRIKYR